MSITVARVIDIADGTRPGQFTVGAREQIDSLADLDDTYRRLLDEPSTCVLGIVGPDGRVRQTPVWFDYEADSIYVNLAAHRKRVDWIRRQGHVSALLVNPQNAYHWASISASVTRELSEDDPVDGPFVTRQIDRIWTKYTGEPPPYGLRDPSMNERRLLFACTVDRVATFGQP